MLATKPIHPKIPANDVERAKHFYERLGFQQIGEGPTGVFYGSGDTKFYVFKSCQCRYE